MKINLTRTDKIELLKAVKNGMLDTSKIPNIVKEIVNIEPFLELMQEASLQKNEVDNSQN